MFYSMRAFIGFLPRKRRGVCHKEVKSLALVCWPFDNFVHQFTMVTKLCF